MTVFDLALITFCETRARVITERGEWNGTCEQLRNADHINNREVTLTWIEDGMLIIDATNYNC